MSKYFFVFFCFFTTVVSAQVLGQRPQISDSNSGLAIQYYRDGEFEKAAAIFEKLFEKPNNNLYFNIYFNTLLKLKKYSQAEVLIKKGIKEDPTNDDYVIAQGKIYQEKGDEKNADKIFSKLINQLPKDEFKVRILANSFYQYGNYDEAVETFKRGRVLLNDSNAFTFELINLYRFRKDKPMLMQTYLDVLATMPELLPQAETVLSNTFDDNADYVNFQTGILKKIQKQPDATVYIKLLTWNYIQMQQYDMALRQLIAFDKRTKDDGATLFSTLQVFASNRAFDSAIKGYEYLVAKGEDNPYFLPAKVELLNTKYNLLLEGIKPAEDVGKLAQEYEDLLTKYGKNKNTLFAAQKLAQLNAYYLNNPKKAQVILEETLKIPGLPEMVIGQLKLSLGDIYILTNQPWDAFLVYEQVAKQFEGQQIANEASFKSAELSFYQRNFAYALSQCQVLKAATSQLIANDALNLSLLITDNNQDPKDSSALKMYADAEMLTFRKKTQAAIQKLDSINVVYPQNSLADAVLMSKAKIYISKADYSRAAETLISLATLYKDGIFTDDALFMLGDLYETKLHDKEKAKTYFEKLITDYSGSMFVGDARKRFRALRGNDGV
ncbi:putative Zn-dependent protease [Pedobacter sp. UYP30]|uniref:tetratricopeptide repeat protein n=1 Tax=Pedobacter sp. UYP30 TaxID=1756400 RepID=UPI0033955583